MCPLVRWVEKARGDNACEFKLQLVPPTNTGGMMAASAVLMCGSAHTGIVSERAVDATNGSLLSMSPWRRECRRAHDRVHDLQPDQVMPVASEATAVRADCVC